MQVNCKFETTWACWDFVSWLVKDQPEGVFPYRLEKWCKREDTVHQIRLTQSFAEGRAKDDRRSVGNEVNSRATHSGSERLGRFTRLVCLIRHRVFVALKKWAQYTVRVVKTRDVRGSTSYENDKLRDWPTCEAKQCSYKPNDSKHGGFLHCFKEVQGEPKLVDFSRVQDPNGNYLEETPVWKRKLRLVRDSTRAECDKGAVFWEERQRDWEAFFSAVPWSGPGGLPECRKPKFAISVPTAKRARERSQETATAEATTKTVGLDEIGQLRLFYKGGQDTADYQPASLWAHFSGKLVGGTGYVIRRKQYGK